MCQEFTWPFQDIGFLLLHTGQKLATHHHLQTIKLPSQINLLASIVDMAKEALQHVDSHCMIDAVNAYHQQLAHLHLVAEHSIKHITFFQNQPDILAVKGCGAMGADVLLLLTPKLKLITTMRQLTAIGWDVLATSADLYDGKKSVPTSNF